MWIYTILRGRDHIRRMYEYKGRWVDAYLETEDLDEANSRSEFKIYPLADATGLNEKLRFLKDRKLNLYNRP